MKSLFLFTAIALSFGFILYRVVFVANLEGYNVPSPSGDNLPSTGTVSAVPEAPSPSASASPQVTQKPRPTSGTILIDIPFVSQAPLGNWKDPRQQNGCEEAVLIMANLWVTGKILTPAEAEQAIIAFTKFEEQKYGHYKDMSAQDTAHMMRDYFQYDKYAVRRSISVQDIEAEIRQGNAVIVPVNGQRLGNPYYTQPGPLTHMLVIRGYDYDKGEFITNDPGLRTKGDRYRYAEAKLAGALQDYPTGPEHGEQKPGDTAMIVVFKN